MHENAVVPIEGYHIGDGADRHEVEPLREIRLVEAASREVALVAQSIAHRAHDVERDADPGEIGAGKRRTRNVRIDQRARGRQVVARQVVVRDDDVHAVVTSQRHALDAGHAVVHRDDHARPPIERDAHQFGGQAVAILEPVRHDEVHITRAERS